MLPRRQMTEIAKVYEYRSLVADYVEQSMARLAISAQAIDIAQAAQIDSSFRLDTALLRHAFEQHIIAPVLGLLERHTVALPAEQEPAPSEEILPAKYKSNTPASRYLLGIMAVDPLTDTWSVVTGTHASNGRSPQARASEIHTKTLVAAIRGPINPFSSAPR